MTEVAPQPTPTPAPTTSAFSASAGGKDVLILAGYGLTTYGLYNVLITLLSGSGGPEVVVQRIAQLVTLFPMLFLGPALVHAAQPSARRETSLQHVLLRWLVLVSALAYLAFIPLSFFTQYSAERAAINSLKRQEIQLQKRRKEIVAAIGTAATPDQFRTALLQFPEISQINISPTDSPATVRDNISSDIAQGIRSQIQQGRDGIKARIQVLGAVVRTAALGSLVSGVAMLALALRIIPWLEPLSRSTTQTGTALVGWTRGLFRRRPAAPRRPGLGMQLQKTNQNLRRSLQRMSRRWQEQRRAKRLKQRR